MAISEDARQLAIRSCRFCPMCHHADLTVTLERRETYSARGRGVLLFDIENGKADWNAEVSDVMFRYFADGLCRHVCAGHIPHDDLVIDARRRLIAAGQAPRVVAQIRSNLETTGNAWGEREPDLRALTQAEPRGSMLIYFGSAARIQRPSVAKALAAIVKKAGVRFTVLAGEGDPGLLLHQLGETEAGAAAARALAAKITASGVRAVVTPDADAYRTLKAGFGEVLPISGVEVRHGSELLTELAGGLKFRSPAHLQATYHDPCALARFAPCVDAPRRLIETICGAPPLEMDPWNRDLANCSGECGGVPFTHPALARKAAERRIREAQAAGAQLVVAGSPAAAAVLEGGNLAVRELCEFAAESLA